MHHCSAVFCFTTMVYIHYTLGLFKGLFKRSLHVIIFFYDFSDLWFISNFEASKSSAPFLKSVCY